MKAVSALAALALAPAATAPPTKTVSTAGATLRVPTGWHAVIAKTPTCDPVRLIVVSSAQLHVTSSGRLSPPPNGEVLILLLEDRYYQDRPLGNLRRPAHFTVTWNRLARLKPLCGNPDVPAFMHYFKTRGRYLGFIVYPRARISPEIRARTLAIMDSLRVAPR